MAKTLLLLIICSSPLLVLCQDVKPKQYYQAFEQLSQLNKEQDKLLEDWSKVPIDPAVEKVLTYTFIEDPGHRCRPGKLVQSSSFLRSNERTPRRVAMRTFCSSVSSLM